ncbi:aminotransferase class III-fold pyridoxal phosphate-dependent enzyme [Halorubrum sp. AD140]|uniref:aminotransferase class III-fold pyridoxal phosphate-dependent enzyme n=1 Tax=Halorubrum sp. AD140 TaxID=3050073 RepID=UPI002ACD10D0|nr:aminotransferase class III-fold pyridoxal phosphate-dependent enzyme [Halorubrum sp. AD140]MDZ5812349.1 aminotransferase class III-fold pyridoxal phosphate-dependent enzyme [Halorubrum sp. AD140]
MDRHTATPEVTDLPGDRAREWVEYHHRSAAPSTYVYEFVWDRTAPAEGPFCTDVDGNVLMDFTSHVAAAPLGYNNPLIMEPLSEFDLIDPLKIAGQDFYVAGGESPGDGLPGSSGLMDRLTEVTAHYDMDTVFLSNSGAEAVENAIKIAYDDSSGAKHAITFDGAFHGRTLGALSLNRSKSVYRRDFPEISGVHDAPFCDDRTCTPETCSCGFFAGGVSRLREKLDPERGHVDPDDVAYLILEPIQGEGGYRFPSDAFTDEIAALVDEHDITLIADEIQSGVGRTGELWGSDHYALEPDVISSAKGLRVGATISTSDVFPGDKSRISSTWGAGDVIASAQGALTLDAIREHDLMDNAATRGRQFKETMRDADLPGVVDVRGKGLLLAVEFDSKERRDVVLKRAFSRGLLTLACGHDVLRVLPPLDVTEREIELGCDLLAAAISDAA